MLQIPLWKRVLILAVILAGIVYAAPNAFYNRVEGHNDALAAQIKTGTLTAPEQKAKAGWPDWLPSDLVNLGLDLRGGAQLLAQVNVGDVYKSRIDALWPEFRTALSAQRATLGGIRRVQSEPGVLRIRIANADQMQKAIEIAQTLNTPVTSLTGVGQKTYAISSDGDQLVIQLSDAEKASTDDRTVQQSLEIVRRRIDAAGTREPTIVREGADRILIQVPGLKSAQELKALIGTTAKLTFNSVISTTSNPDQVVGAGEELLPASDQKGLYYVIDAAPVVTGEDLTDARPDTDQNGYPAVAFRFNVSAARTFGDYTQANIGKPFAIVLDNKVISAPVIQSHIAGGSGIITGRFTVKEATDLALLLRAGALPASMTFLEERTIGPELGRGFDQGRQAGRRRRRSAGRGLHGRVLWHVRGVCLDRAGDQHRADLCDHVGDRGHADAAGDCRDRADDGHGGGCQCAGFRADTRRAQDRQETRPRDRAGL